MRIAVTGKTGQVVTSLLERGGARQDVEIVTLGRPELDLLEPKTIAPAIAAARPDLVVSAAAYTAVDQAEDEPEVAFAINADGAGEVARAAADLGVPVIHISTDYVFDGKAERPYKESDPTNPQGVYGASKLAGEHAVAAANPRHLILRTAWVYSPFGKNFVKTMLRLAETRDEVAVVADQVGCPTSAARHRRRCIGGGETRRGGYRLRQWGTYHFAGGGEASWADFAEAIFSVSREIGGPWANVRRIETHEFPTKATRPANSRLDSTSFLKRLAMQRRNGK